MAVILLLNQIDQTVISLIIPPINKALMLFPTVIFLKTLQIAGAVLEKEFFFG